MNKIISKICFFFVVFFSLYACQKDDVEKIVTITPGTLTLNNAGENKYVELTANTSWMVVIPREVTWCQVSPMTGSGDALLTVTANPNLTPMQKSIKIAIRYDDKSVTLQLAQEAQTGEGNYLEGEVRIYEQNRLEKPVNLVFLGDGFIAEDYAQDGAFDRAVAEAVEAWFDVEPYKTYREYFNIYKMANFSKERGITYQDLGEFRDTYFGTKYKGGSSMETNDEKIFALVKAIPGIDLEKTAIILIANDPRYAGTTMLYSSGRSIAICPMNRNPQLPGGFGPIVLHEAGGHGFGQLADEYTNDNQITPSDSEINELKQWFGFNYYQNIDITNNLEQIKWHDFVGRSGYEAVAAYEGAFYHEVGVWRPEYISCMNDNRSYFNAPSRAAIVKRILSIAGEEYTIEGFIARDVVKTPPAALAAKSVTAQLPRLAPPVLKDNR